MKSVFISYSSKQSDEADRICKLLEAEGISCFISTRDLLPGEEYASQLLNHIDEAKVVVLLLSRDSNDSPHVLREVEYAVSHKTPILVYALEKVELSKSMEYFLMTHQWITGNGNLDLKLVNSINHLIDKAPVEEKKVINSKKPNNRLLLGSIALILFLIIIALGTVLSIGLINRFKALPDNSYSAENISQNVQYSLGDTITFGTYYDEPIEWRVLKINDDGTMILVSKEILCFKTYDAAECGTYNELDGVSYWSYENSQVEDNALRIKIRGNNSWAESNIRTWLNAEGEVVNYKDQAPTKMAVGDNFYSTEAGFLNGFTSDEIAAIKSVTHSEVEDRVFLLSSAELIWFDEAGISIYAKPSASCLANDKDPELYEGYVNTTNVDSYPWWLRDSSSEYSNEVNTVNSEYNEETKYTTASVGVYTYGVRPAICVDMNKLN